jgi:hypothetical protein
MKNTREKKQEKYDKLASKAFWTIGMHDQNFDKIDYILTKRR